MRLALVCASAAVSLPATLSVWGQALDNVVSDIVIESVEEVATMTQDIRSFDLTPFYTSQRDGVHVAPEQASRFAKRVAGDFNPIHDPCAKRFCVPGDLLFCLVLENYGLSSHMSFKFAGMVGADVALQLPRSPGNAFDIRDPTGKVYLEVERNGEHCSDRRFIQVLGCKYVAFSGQNFPHILVPLMAEHQVMINPERPLVIYESMSFDLVRLTGADLNLQLTSTELDVHGKRADAHLFFTITCDGEKVGTGRKKLVLSGLRKYDEARVASMVAGYMAKKSAYDTVA